MEHELRIQAELGPEAERRRVLLLVLGKLGTPVRRWWWVVVGMSRECGGQVCIGGRDAQADQRTVNPAQNVRHIFALRPVHRDARHQHL